MKWPLVLESLLTHTAANKDPYMDHFTVSREILARILFSRIALTLSLPSTSKNQYLSAMHVSRTPEY